MHLDSVSELYLPRYAASMPDAWLIRAFAFALQTKAWSSMKGELIKFTEAERNWRKKSKSCQQMVQDRLDAGMEKQLFSAPDFPT